MSESPERPILFLDFDGTISTADVVDAVLEQLAEAGWDRLEEAWKAGRIGSRECLAGQMALVRATEARLLEVVDRIGLDRGFGALMDIAVRHDLPVAIVSDGFDFCIRRLLASVPGVERALRGRVYSSHLELAGTDRWRTAFPHFAHPCGHGCATCKPGLMAELNRAGAPAIFVGDGLSDRYAAQVADLVLAKTGLASHCEREGIAFVHYSGLSDVAALIEDGLLSRRDWRAAAAPVRRVSGAGAA